VNRRAFLLWLPLALFIGLASAFVLGLHKPDDQTIVSKMVGATVPDFALPAATAGIPALGAGDLKGQGPHLVNFFASWCVPCAAEAPILAALAEQKVSIVGIAVRDRPEAVVAFLKRYGNPYARIGSDRHGQVEIDFGSSGVPETFVVDGKGIIRLQVIGPIGPQNLDDIRKAMAG
jgi:cytochrome c biogenesis protein CcmG/thiol:disulfide interchange protein DsbE